MDFIFVVIAMSIHAIFIWNRKWLFEKQSFLMLCAASLVIFVVSYVLLAADVGDPNLVVLIRIPLIALVIFFIMRRAFYQIYDRNPQDTFWSMDTKLMKDGIFNFSFWVIGLLVPIFLAYNVF